MPQILFAVYANQKIRRSVWAKAHESARILKDSRGRAIQWDCRSEEEYFLIKMQKLTKEKFAKRFPLWRERGTVRFSEWWKVECCMWINGNNGNMLHFFRFMKTQEYKSELRESLRNEAPFWRERGTIRFNEWWIVDCYMLEHRKKTKMFDITIL